MGVEHITSHFTLLPLRIAVIDGGSAGDHTVTDIDVHDQLMCVFEIEGAESGALSSSRVSNDFEITAKDTINNTGGDDTTDKLLMVMWQKRHPGSAGVYS